MSGTSQLPDDRGAAERLARVEARLSRLEEYLNIAPAGPASAPSPEAARRKEDELEFRVGQNWFAAVGILALVIGAAFTLSLPYPGLPDAAPSLLGYGVACALVLLARAGRRSFELVSGNLRGAAMALLTFATLRLCYFGERHALSADSLAGGAALALAASANLALALRWRSPWLCAVALASGCAAALAVGTDGFVLVAVIALAAAAAAVGRRFDWPAFNLLGISLAYATYLVWAMGDPLLGRPFGVVAGPPACLACLLASASILAAGPWGRRPGAPEDALSNLSALFNCGAGYGLFLLHALASFGTIFVAANAAASAVFLGIAVAYWARHRSRVATFIYAMTGYLALSLAIIRAAEVPQVFIWLSLQSVVVVATAIWFQSRFIVVANFLIYASIVVAYIALARVETGISLAFGVVALGTARLLNWQRSRLELKTELMRNAYLASALVVFPYALYHMVPGAYVGLAWVGVALLYYAISFVVRNRKYRWMGHATLLLTALYLVAIGISRLEPVHRNLSFLVLGSVLVIVSLVFTRLRSRGAGPARPRRPDEA